MVRASQVELNEVMKQKSRISESSYIAKTAAIAAKGKVALHQHRQRNMEKHRMESLSSQSHAQRQVDKQRRLKMTGFIQPARESIFEPMIFALQRLELRGPARYGLNSRVLAQVSDAKRKLNRYLPPRKSRAVPFHACSKRGRAAILARRLVKKAPRSSTLVSTMHVDEELGLLDESELQRWMKLQFDVRQ